MRVVVLVVLIAACGFQAPDRGASEPGVDAPPEHPPLPPVDAPPAPPAITPQALVVQMVTRECQAAFGCRSQYPSGGRPFEEAWGTDLNHCLAIDHNYRARDSIATSCASGVIAWDAAAARTCFDDPGIPTSCAALFAFDWSWAPACLTALAGTVPDGGSCQNDWECASHSSDCRSGRCTR